MDSIINTKKLKNDINNLNKKLEEQALKHQKEMSELCQKFESLQKLISSQNIQNQNNQEI